MRMIDADALIAQMEADAEKMDEPIAQMFVYAAINDIKHAPTIERKTGKWMHDKDDVLYSGYCSCCGWESVIGETDVADMSYCPNCGADMRETP